MVLAGELLDLRYYVAVGGAREPWRRRVWPLSWPATPSTRNPTRPSSATPAPPDGDSVENRGTAWSPGFYRKHHSEVNAGSRTDRLRDLVWDVANHDIHDIFEGQRTLSKLHERLRETETYDEILFRPLKETVEAVCADLGLTPDWSRWTGDGWLPPTSGY